MPKSTYIQAMHPKAEISPTAAAIEKMLESGWAGQTKIHGHRVQIHLSASDKEPAIAYNRQGRPHKMLLPLETQDELRRLLSPEKGWTAVDGEWLKGENKIYLFDVLKRNDQILRRLTYKERWDLLPHDYISPYIQTLPLLTTVNRCLGVLASPQEWVEGLVFKSLGSKGFEDTAIVRCRKR